MINRLRQIKTNSVLWIHIDRPTEHEIQYLRDSFEFHPLDLEDCMNTAQRPKVDEYSKYIFLVLLFPFYDRRERTIHAAELDFFVGPNYVITVSDGKHEIVDRLFADCLKSEVFRERFMAQSPAHLLFEILDRLQTGIFPMLDHISQDIVDIERQVFSGAEKRMVRDILLIKRNIVNFRRIVNAHKSTIKKLMDIHKHGIFSLSSNLAVYFGYILDRSKDIWEILENHKETINAFQEANDSLITFKLNEIMKILTAISVSILPATLVASLFGMNIGGAPFIGNPFGFWILTVAMMIISVFLIGYFKKKDWL